MFKKRKAVERIIILFTITLVGFMVIISLLTFTYSKNFVQSSTKDKAKQILSQTCSQAENMLYTINQSTKLLMSKTNLMQVLEYEGYYTSRNYAEKEQLASILNDFVFINKNIEAAYIFDYLGNIYSTRSYHGSYGAADFFKAAGFSPGNLVWMGTNAAGQLVACKEIYNISLKPVGVLVIDMDKSLFSEIFQWQSEELNAMACIVDRNSGLVIYDSHGTAGTASLEMAQNQEGNGTALQAQRRIHGKNFYYYRYDSPNHGFTYFYYVPAGYFTRGLSQICVIILFITLAFLLLILLLYYYVKTTIQKPLNQMIGCVNHYALKGDMPQADFYHDDEFKELYLHFTRMGRRIQHLVGTTYELEILSKNQELKILQAQMNPHFIYNTLELVNSIAANHRLTQICRLAKSLSNIMRYTISSCQDEVPLSREIYHINEYMNIQKERFMGGLTYTEEIDGQVLELPVMKLTLQPIIENCFYHGFQGKWEDCRIQLKAFPYGRGFAVTITDNGIGIGPETIASIFSGTELDTSGNGVALKNIHRRLQLKYGPKSGLEIQSGRGHGTCITILVERSTPCLS